MFLPSGKASDEANMAILARRIERRAKEQHDALFVTLGSTGNNGTQLAMANIRMDAREIAEYFDKIK